MRVFLGIFLKKLSNFYQKLNDDFRKNENQGYPIVQFDSQKVNTRSNSKKRT